MVRAKVISIVVVGVLASTSVLSAGESAHLTATLSAEPSRTLPAIPVRLVLTVENVTGDTQLLPSWMAIRVTPSSGESFIAATGSAMLHAPTDNVIAAHSKRRFVFSTFAQDAPIWFVDKRLNFPDTYRLDALLSDVSLTVDSPIESIDIASPDVIIASTSAILTIDQPTGVDAVAWKRIRSLAESKFGGTGWSEKYWAPIRDQAALEVWRDFPTSTYAAYLIDAVATDPQRKIDMARRALALRPPNADTVLFVIAAMHARLSREAQTERHRNAHEALDYSQTARQELLALLDKSDDPRVHRAVREELEQLLSPEQIIAADAEIEEALRSKPRPH